MKNVGYVPFGLRIGTIVSTWIGPIEHFGLVTAYTQWGEPVVASISMKDGFARQLLTGFAKAQGTYGFGYPSSLPEYEVLARVYSVADKPYHLANWNCEHFVRYGHGLPPESPQVARATIIAFAAIAIFALAKAA
jgi:hypothetical protein